MEISASSNSLPETSKVKPRCRHFGECGGCRLQDVPYEAQLAAKAESLRGLMERAGWAAAVNVRPSPEQWFYRNKMEFSFQDVYPVPPAGGDPLLLGLKRRNRWDKVLNLAECFLMSPEVPALLESVHAWARKEKLEPYNLHKQVGFLRHLLVREGKNTGERTVHLITAPGQLPARGFVEAVRSSYPASTVLRGVYSGKADVAFSDSIEILHGEGCLHEEILGKRVRISPHAFFQTNTRGAELLYGMLREWLAQLRPKRLLDLYCGVGSISFCLADLCENVFGVEVAESAVADARANASELGMRNVEFQAAKAEELLPAFAAQGVDVDVVVADPPRSGLHPAVVEALKTLSPGWILYVSCNPKAMAEDIRKLSSSFDLQKVEGIDLFPHTDHLESVALLRSAFLQG